MLITKHYPIVNMFSQFLRITDWKLLPAYPIVLINGITNKNKLKNNLKINKMILITMLIAHSQNSFYSMLLNPKFDVNNFNPQTLWR